MFFVAAGLAGAKVAGGYLWYQRREARKRDDERSDHREARQERINKRKQLREQSHKNPHPYFSKEEEEEYYSGLYPSDEYPSDTDEHYHSSTDLNSLSSNHNRHHHRAHSHRKSHSSPQSPSLPVRRNHSISHSDHSDSLDTPPALPSRHHNNSNPPVPFREIKSYTDISNPPPVLNSILRSNTEADIPNNYYNRASAKPPPIPSISVTNSDTTTFIPPSAPPVPKGKPKLPTYEESIISQDPTELNSDLSDFIDAVSDPSTYISQVNTISDTEIKTIADSLENSHISERKENDNIKDNQKVYRYNPFRDPKLKSTANTNISIYPKDANQISSPNKDQQQISTFQRENNQSNGNGAREFNVKTFKENRNITERKQGTTEKPISPTRPPIPSTSSRSRPPIPTAYTRAQPPIPSLHAPPVPHPH